MSRREFNQCLAYLQIEPPEHGDNIRTASLMAQIGNFAGKSLKKGTTLTADDYLGKSKPVQQTRADQMAFLRGIKEE